MKAAVYGGILLIFLAGELLRKRQRDKIMRQLFLYMKAMDKSSFDRLLESSVCRLLFSASSRYIMNLKMAIQAKEGAAVQDIYDEFALAPHKLKLGGRNFIAASQLLFQYMIENKEFDSARHIYQLAAPVLTKKSSSEMQMLLLDMEQVLAIYADHDINRIKEVEALLEAAPTPQAKAIYQYRLAMLHYYNDEPQKSRQLLTMALDNTSGAQSKAMIENMLAKDVLEF